MSRQPKRKPRQQLPKKEVKRSITRGQFHDIVKKAAQPINFDDRYNEWLGYPLVSNMRDNIATDAQKALMEELINNEADSAMITDTNSLYISGDKMKFYLQHFGLE